MRRIRFVPLLLAVLLLACQGTAPAGLAPAGLAPDAIAVTPLDTAAPAPDADTPHPKPKPAVLADTPAPPEPEAPKSAGQMLCEKSKGQWMSAGDTGANYCASLTRDGGRQCHKKSDCQGQCLARSGTCSPITPLYGCNDILEKDGGEVTMCID